VTVKNSMFYRVRQDSESWDHYVLESGIGWRPLGLVCFIEWGMVW